MPIHVLPDGTVNDALKMDVGFADHHTTLLN